MRQSDMKNLSVRTGDSAAKRLEEAGSMLETLFYDRPRSNKAFMAFMELQLETAEIQQNLYDRQESDAIELLRWILPKQRILARELKRRHMQQRPEARFACRKIQAVMDWVIDWYGKLLVGSA